jgi:hypothetical protein
MLVLLFRTAESATACTCGCALTLGRSAAQSPTFIALIDPKMQLLDVNEIQFTDASTHTMRISGASWCDSCTDLSNSLQRGMWLSMGGPSAAWSDDKQQQEIVQSYQLAAVKVEVPGISRERPDGTAQGTLAAVDAFLVSSHLGCFSAYRICAHFPGWCLSGALLSVDASAVRLKMPHQAAPLCCQTSVTRTQSGGPHV